MDSDSSSYIETTYSEDDRICRHLREAKEDLKLKMTVLERQREQEFIEYCLSEQTIFDLPGLEFEYFTHKRVKFSFRPCNVVRFVSQKVIFYCSLRYVDNHWMVKRDSFPNNFKWRIYRLFWGDKWFTVSDATLVHVILKIYGILKEWAQKEEVFRKGLQQRYLSGEDMELDSDAEELFLTDNERRHLFEKRDRIWRRMLPPD